MAWRCIRKYSAKATREIPLFNSGKEILIPSEKYKLAEKLWSPKPPKSVKVSLIGADSTAGTMAAFFLKQNPLISKIYLYGTKEVEHLAGDMSLIDTSCKVEAYWGEDNLGQALRAADIVALLDVDVKDSKVKRKFKLSCTRVEKVAEHYILHCPRAIFLVCVEPVCCMVPLVQKIIESTPWYHPSKLLGSVASIQNHLNSLVGDILYLDPACIQLPLIGGPDVDTIVPLVTLLTPNPWLDINEAQKFYGSLTEELSNKKERISHPKSTADEGFAIARLVLTVAKGLCGHDDAVTTAFVKTNVVQQLRYIVTTVQFGEGGIAKNFGIPHMSRFELEKFEQSLLVLEEREKYAESYFRRIEKQLNYKSC